MSRTALHSSKPIPARPNKPTNGTSKLQVVQHQGHLVPASGWKRSTTHHGSQNQTADAAAENVPGYHRKICRFPMQRHPLIITLDDPRGRFEAYRSANSVKIT